MKNPDLAEKHDAYSRSLALADLRTQCKEESFDVRPMNCSADRAAKDLFERRAMLSFHKRLVLYYGTASNCI